MKSHATVWERPERVSRPAVEPLSRDRIVRAAIAIADTHGLGAVSLRRVAAALDAGPMRLYGYMSTKEELLELMVDSVYGEMLERVRGDWRQGLRAIAHRTRRVARKHPWLIDLLGGRPHLGPNALAYLEAALQAARGFKDIDAALGAVNTVNAYVIGALRSEASDLERGLERARWQKMYAPYMLRVIATGRFPMLAQVVRDANHASPDAAFDRGLECVLAGLGVQRTGGKTRVRAPVAKRHR